MPRHTLKLPASPAPVFAGDDLRSRSKKPVRSGFKSPKQSLAQKGEQQARAEKRFDAAAARERPSGQRPAQSATYPTRGSARPPAAEARRGPPTARPAPQRPLPPPVAPAIEVGAPSSSPKEHPRLSRRMSELGLCSRREADEWIENGWVSVEGVVINTLGARVHPNAKIDIKAAASKHQSESVTILLNKPVDIACGPVEDGPSAAFSLIRRENHWAEDYATFSFKATHLRGLALAGKLDDDSSGMLVFTQEGSVARRVIGDDARLEKEYQVRVTGELVAHGLEQLKHGLSLDDIQLKPAQVSWQNEEQLRFVLRENRKQQIQRMCALVGLTVVSIKRIRVGSVSLGKLPAGQWRYLREGERF